MSKISNVEGDVSCVMVRGKKKVGFSLKMDIEVEKGPQFITIKFEDFNEYSEHEVGNSGSGWADKLVRDCSGYSKQIQGRGVHG